MICTSRSSMNILNSQEIDILVARSQLVTKYDETINRDCAHEMLSRQIDMMQGFNSELKKAKHRINSIPNEVPAYNYYNHYRQSISISIVLSTTWQRPTTNKKRAKQDRRNASTHTSTFSFIKIS
jgi:hypothetical protein